MQPAACSLQPAEMKTIMQYVSDDIDSYVSELYESTYSNLLDFVPNMMKIKKLYELDIDKYLYGWKLYQM